MNRLFYLFVTLFIFLTTSTRAQLALGQWRVHLPYNQAQSVTESTDKIYVAANDAVFIYDKNDNSVKALSKVNGLSDIGVNTIRYNSYNKVVVVGYSNGNIDLFKNNSIINVGDISRKNIPGGKAIHHILFVNNLAYLSCSFGIIVLDTDKDEIKDTYYISQLGNTIGVYATANQANNIYAATDSGVYQADLNDPFIFNPSHWNMVFSKTLSSGPFNLATSLGNKIFVNHQINATTDSVYYYDGSQWLPFSVDALNTNRMFTSTTNQLVVCNTYSIITFDNNLNQTSKIITYGNKIANPYDAMYSSNGNLIIADGYYGLINYNAGNYESIFPNGPQSAKAAQIKISQGNLWVGHAIRNNNWFPLGAQDGFSSFIKGLWSSYNSRTILNPTVNLDTVTDLVCTAIDPQNPNHAFFGSWGHGLLEYNNGIQTLYNPSNSALQNIVGFPNYYSVRIGGVAFDRDNNVWITNSYVENSVVIKKAAGGWKALKPYYVDASNIICDVLVDSYNQKWFNIYRKGLLVLDDNGTLDNAQDDRYSFLNDIAGQGSLPSANVFCMVEDHEGQIWVGTEKGVAVFYSPGSAFEQGGADAQQILINYGGYNEYLLDKEFVTTIAVDGANRKWIGTQSSGVFLMSADGTKQILNFNVDNSPLLSNNVVTIAIDDKTGEVFLGTERGIISYQGDAIEGEAGCKDVYVYPNPVRETYTGKIAIKGLATNGNVKITDITGNLVYETTALGSQAIWDGNDFSGRRVHTGIYLILCSDSDGSNTCITKLLFVN